MSSQSFLSSSSLEIPANEEQARQHPWFAVRVKSRFEKATAIYLRGKGYEEFSPLYTSRRKWSDRIKEVELPLFPGYLFCRFDPNDRLPILSSPGVVSIVGIGKVPVAVEEREIAQVQSVLHSGLPTQPWPYLHLGQKVYIKEGALAGLEGLLVQVKNQARLVVSVSLLQRSVAVEIDRENVRPTS